jgi:hypothetical protein
MDNALRFSDQDQADDFSALGFDSDLDLFAEEFGDDGFQDEWDALTEELDSFDGFDAANALDDFQEDMADEFGDFALDGASGLFVPQAPRLISGQAALAIARQLNPAVLQSMDADDAEAFLRRVGGFVRRAARTVGRGVSRVARVAAPALRGIARVAGPVLRRALPMIQRVAGFAGPWGRLVSAGIGAAQGLMSGRGLRGALAGAVGGLIPGVGGQLASSILGGDGADDDAALDALADMADSGEVDAAVALPMGAGLAARMAVRRGLGGRQAGVPGGVMPQDRRAWRYARAAEQIMLVAARAARGSTGRRLRVLRSIGRLASELVRRRHAQTGPGPALQALPSAVRAASRRVLAQARSDSRAGTSSPDSAARRNAMRQRILRRVPASIMLRGNGHHSDIPA